MKISFLGQFENGYSWRMGWRRSIAIKITKTLKIATTKTIAITLKVKITIEEKIKISFTIRFVSYKEIIFTFIYIFIQNAKTHVIEVDHVTRKSLEAGLQVKVAAEADRELPRKNHEDHDQDLEWRSLVQTIRISTI